MPTTSPVEPGIRIAIQPCGELVETYWVEDVRNVQRKDGSLTPAGEAYRDKESPLSYIQAKP